MSDPNPHARNSSTNTQNNHAPYTSTSRILLTAPFALLLLAFFFSLLLLLRAPALKPTRFYFLLRAPAPFSIFLPLYKAAPKIRGRSPLRPLTKGRENKNIGPNYQTKNKVLFLSNPVFRGLMIPLSLIFGAAL